MARAHQELSEFMQAVMKFEAGEPEPETIRGGELDCHHDWRKPVGTTSITMCAKCGATGELYTDADLAEEWSDAMHFVFEASIAKIPHTDLEVALQNKINSNWRNKKKTIDASGKAVLK